MLEVDLGISGSETMDNARMQVGVSEQSRLQEDGRYCQARGAFSTTRLEPEDSRRFLAGWSSAKATAP